MREFDAPFTVYVVSDFAEGTGRVWWIALERLIAKAGAIDVAVGDGAVHFDLATPAAKQIAFERLRRLLRSLPGDENICHEVAALCARHGINDGCISRDLCMSWDELKAFAGDPLVTIGAHTITHCNLAKQSDAIAKQEMAISRARIEDMLQCPIEHFSYPYGDKAAAGAREFALARSVGFKTAVTTRPGMIFPETADHLTALPRVSLNGNYQASRILPVLTSGAATAMWNGFRRVDAA
jgi:peptidoglycan/xylan/chitin deacetylase (PgdA/CDA1 family)